MSPNDLPIFLSRMILDFDRGTAAQSWKNERFSILGEDCGYPHADLDVIFFWKIFDQRWLARKSQKVFESLARTAEKGTNMVRALSEVKEEWAKSALMKVYYDGRLRERCPNVHDAFFFGRGGWTVLGYSIRAAQKLVSLFGDHVEDSYVQLWLSRFLLGLLGSDPVSGASLTNIINERFSKCITDSLADTHCRLEKEFLQRLLRNDAKLCGSGPATLQYFFRDWCDLILWPYMFKLDSTNQEFWKVVLTRFGIVEKLHELDEPRIIGILSQNLTSEQIRNGAIAKLNTYVYRKMSKGGSGEHGITENEIEGYIDEVMK